MGTKMLLTLQIFQMYTHRKKQWGGDSVLRGTQELNCCSDRELWELCCLLGAKVRDVVQRVPQLVKSTNFSPLLPFHVGINNTATRTWTKSKKMTKLGCTAKVLVPELHFLAFYQLEKRMQPETDILCKQTSGLVAGAVLRGLAFATGHSSIIIASQGGMGYFYLEEARESLMVGCPTWWCMLSMEGLRGQGSKICCFF